MNEKIEVRYSIVGGGAQTSVSVYHKYIVYTDNAGKEYYARGGPYTDTTIPLYSSYALTILETEYGEHKPGSREWDGNEPQLDPKETIFVGTDLSNYWDAIKDRMDGIDDEHYLYNFTWQNSNSTIDDVLNYVGLPAAQNPSSYRVPGSDIPLEFSVPTELPSITLPQWLLPAASMFDFAAGRESPLVLDMDGDGVETTQLGYTSESSNVYFDLDNDGFAERTGWVTGGDGLLAWDRNSNGNIDNQSELFGNSSSYTDGFASLAALDTNSDNKITSADANWANLRIWVDANSDGITDAGELKTLASLNITQISLSTTAHTDLYNNENLVTASSTFVIDGVTRTISDVWFRNDGMDSRSIDEVELNEEVFFLPTLKGFGQLKDLHVAMSENSDLLDLVRDFTTSWSTEKFADKAAFDDEIKEILYTWAGVEGVSPTARGLYADARDVGFLEHLFDKPYVSLGNTNEVEGAAQAGPFYESFNYVLAHLEAQLIAQVGGASLYSERPLYNYISGEIIGGVLSDTAISALSAEANSSPDATNYWINAVTALINIKNVGAFTSSEISTLDAAIQVSLPGSSWSSILGQSIVPIIGGHFLATDFSDYLVGDYISDPILGQEGDDLIMGYNGDDYLEGNNGNDSLYGGFDNDALLGGNGNDLLEGEGGDDALVGGAGNDIINGGSGDDTLEDSSGDDIYVFSSGFGQDSLFDNDGYNILQFKEGITSSDITLFRPNSSSNLVIQVGLFDQITLWNHFSNWQAQAIYLADSTVISLIDGITFYGTSSDDTVYGSNGGDIIAGLEGSDVLYGGLGNDTYVFNIGFGQDYITDDGGTDVIQLGSGVIDTDLRFIRPVGTNDLVIYVGSADQITLYGHFSDLQSASNYYDEIETLRFSDNSTIDLKGDLVFTGTSADENIWGTLGNDTIIGLAGSDVIYSEDGNDFLYGGDGGDDLYGDNGNDILIGEAGEDFLWGGAGADTFVFKDVDGPGVYDVVMDFNPLQADVLDISDFLKGYDAGKGIIDDFIGIDLYNGNSYLYVDRDGTGGAYSWQNIVVLASITSPTTNPVALINEGFIVVPNSFFGTALADTALSGSVNNDIMFGRDGNDTVSGLSGNDAVYGGNGNDIIRGGDGADILYGENGNDILIGGSGIDRLYGWGDADTFVFEEDTAFSGIDVIGDFVLADHDKIDLSDLLQLYDPLTHAITDFVQITTSGSNSLLKVDVDGSGDGFVQIATIQGITGLTNEAALVASNNLIV